MSSSKDARWARLRSLLETALAKPAEERTQYLVDASGEDANLAEELLSLLAAAESDNGVIEDIVSSAAAQLTRTYDNSRLQQRVGNYRLVSLLGTGGMGNVYLARRMDERFEHEVAIKILQTGRRDAHFVRRFLAERQVLANLDHPNICRLLDGGETEDGVPYLAMEYVNGLPIDVFCDKHKLGISERLGLFQRACLAVDYAHRNLVVHRDIKSSNILVNEDGEIKLLDFGIAKLIDDSGVASDLTVDAMRMLTPEFASPEQVRGEPVAVATDVYSLGVLLYRLLCGRGPYRLRSDMPSDLARAIVEDVPSKPSTALLTVDDATDPVGREISASRHTTAARLRSRLQGDLDNIALMALRKEPARRYISAKALHDDIANYLSHRPVSARPDQFLYRARKFARRNRTGLAVAVSVLTVIGFSLFQVIEQRNRAEFAAAQSEQVTAFLAKLFANASLNNTRGEVVTAVDLLKQGIEDIEQLDEQPAVQGRLMQIMGNSYTWIGEHAAASPLMARSIDLLREHAPNDKEQIATAIGHLADNQRLVGNFDTALELFQECQDTWRQLHGENHSTVAYNYGRIGDTYRKMGRLDDARTSLEAGVAIKQSLGELDDSGGIDIRGNLVLVIDESGKTLEAIVLLKEVVEASRRVDGEKHPNTIIRTGNLGMMQGKVGSLDEALANLSIMSDYSRDVWATNFGQRSWVTYNLGNVLRDLGRIDEAQAMHIESVAVLEQESGVAHAQIIDRLHRLGNHYIETAEFGNARSTLERARTIAEGASESEGAAAIKVQVSMAQLSNLIGEHEVAERYAVRAIKAADSIGWLYTARARRELAISYSALGRDAEALAEFDAVSDVFKSKSESDTVMMLPFLTVAAHHHREISGASSALDYAERARLVSEKLRPTNAWPAALARAEYALTQLKFGDDKEAPAILATAYRDLVAVFGESDWRVLSLREAM